MTVLCRQIRHVQFYLKTAHFYCNKKFCISPLIHLCPTYRLKRKTFLTSFPLHTEMAHLGEFNVSAVEQDVSAIVNENADIEMAEASHPDTENRVESSETNDAVETEVSFTCSVIFSILLF